MALCSVSFSAEISPFAPISPKKSAILALFLLLSSPKPKASSMVQERTYAIPFLVLFILLLPSPLTSVRVEDVSAITGNQCLYFPLFSIDNVTFLVNESLHHSSGVAVVFLNKEFSVHGTNGHVFFLFSQKPVLDGNWSIQIFRSETPQFKNYGNGDVLLGVYTPVLALISIFSALWSYLKKLLKRNEVTPPNPYPDSTISDLLVGFRKFTYSELSSATKYFHQSELLGDGIVASVYRAHFPGSINIYAVKRFNQSSSSRQCYETEVRRIRNLRHKNILELRGWCNENPNEPLLLYDYMPNRSLHDVLSSGKILLWPYRYNIAVGLAKALVYLHHECTPNVIHADIKEENVLLDAELNPKLADFGLSLTGPSTVTESRLQEWVTPKIDVFLYGSLVLELCCRRTEAYRDFIRNLRNLQLQGRVLEAVDEKLGGNFNEEEMVRVLSVGIECVGEEISKRPSMQDVLEMLSSEREVEEGSPDLVIEMHE